MFVCGPIAAGKSTMIKDFEALGLERSVKIDYDTSFKEEFERLSKQSEISKDKLPQITEEFALNARENLFNSCLEQKVPFTYENCLSKSSSDNILSTFQKMEEAKKAGFEVWTYVSYQKNLKTHLTVEKKRRNDGVETGAHLAGDKAAKQAVTGTYNNCINNMEEAIKLSDKSKVYINFMDKNKEFKSSLVAHYEDQKVVFTNERIFNPDVKTKITEINTGLELKKTKQVEKASIKTPKVGVKKNQMEL